jgi:hypothetical protein
MQEDVRRSVEAVVNRPLRPQVYVALNWYDHSKGVDNGSDRLIALWIALEALVGTAERSGNIDRHAAELLASDKFGLNLSSEQIKQALGLSDMRRLRNLIVHEGYRSSSWDLAVSLGRDLPQILDDVVAEILRTEMGLSPTQTLFRHVSAQKAMQPSMHRR